uniref:Uncharacterized protein n=1 Tax=Timema genevievae TaxID=629358 RepID=A0A7R9JUW0_TIMGE|nr:unnamed protein product [Timema genevievae]
MPKLETVLELNRAAMRLPCGVLPGSQRDNEVRQPLPFSGPLIPFPLGEHLGDGFHGETNLLQLFLDVARLIGPKLDPQAQQELLEGAVIFLRPVLEAHSIPRLPGHLHSLSNLGSDGPRHLGVVLHITHDGRDLPLGFGSRPRTTSTRLGRGTAALLPLGFRRFPPLPNASKPWPGPPLYPLSSPNISSKWLELPPDSSSDPWLDSSCINGRSGPEGSPSTSTESYELSTRAKRVTQSSESEENSAGRILPTVTSWREVSELTRVFEGLALTHASVPLSAVFTGEIRLGFPWSGLPLAPLGLHPSCCWEHSLSSPVCGLSALKRASSSFRPLAARTPPVVRGAPLDSTPSALLPTLCMGPALIDEPGPRMHYRMLRWVSSAARSPPVFGGAPLTSPWPSAPTSPVIGEFPLADVLALERSESSPEGDLCWARTAAHSHPVVGGAPLPTSGRLELAPTSPVIWEITPVLLALERTDSSHEGDSHWPWSAARSTPGVGVAPLASTFPAGLLPLERIAAAQASALGLVADHLPPTYELLPDRRSLQSPRTETFDSPSLDGQHKPTADGGSPNAHRQLLLTRGRSLPGKQRKRTCLHRGNKTSRACNVTDSSNWNGPASALRARYELFAVTRLSVFPTNTEVIRQSSWDVKLRMCESSGTAISYHSGYWAKRRGTLYKPDGGVSRKPLVLASDGKLVHPRYVMPPAPAPAGPSAVPRISLLSPPSAQQRQASPYPLTDRLERHRKCITVKLFFIPFAESVLSLKSNLDLPVTGNLLQGETGALDQVINSTAVGQARMSSIVTLPLTLVGAAANAASSVAWFLPMLVAAIAYFHYELHDPESRPIDVDTELLYPQYDFIVNGKKRHGCPGAVVANRLTEIEQWTVLLLEAGGDETEISDVPLLAAYLQLSKLDWKYKTEPQGTACLGEFRHLN